MVKFVSVLLLHLVLETIHPVEESQVNVKDLNISGQARGETTDETGSQFCKANNVIGSLSFRVWRQLIVKRDPLRHS